MKRVNDIKLKKKAIELIIPVDVPIPLVDNNWVAHADIKIFRLVWGNGMTIVDFEIDRIYETPFLTKN